MTGIGEQLRALRRAASWHRRVLAAGLAAGAVAAGLHAVGPPEAAAITVLVADRDLPGGSQLDPAGLRTASMPKALAPVNALRPGADLAGAVLAAPLTAGEVLTTARLVGPSLLEGYDTALVGVPVRLADPAVARLLHTGDLVDVLAADSTGLGMDGAAELDPSVGGGLPDEFPGSAISPGAARVVAPSVRVLTVLADDASSAFGGAGGGGALILVAATPEVAADVAGAEAASRLSVVMRTG